MKAWTAGGERRRSRLQRWRARALPTALLAGLLAPAAGFQTGGHYDTVRSVLGSAITAPDDRQRIEAFCAELPDLSSELDAITQRVDVLLREPGIGWGLQGRCAGPVSQHMVRSQFFLHALTGREVSQARASAGILIQRVNARIGQATQDRQPPRVLANLYCERGFALHLLADTYAHADLHHPGQLYRTGLGHFRDLAEPDYMMRRQAPAYAAQDLWQALVQQLARAWPAGEGHFEAAPALAASDRLSTNDRQHGDTAETEQDLSRLLEDALPPAWNQPPLPDGRNRLGLQTQGCAQQARGYLTAAGVPADRQPDCQQVWDAYLQDAQVAFPAHYRPAASCDIGPAGTPVHDPLR